MKRTQMISLLCVVFAVMLVCAGCAKNTAGHAAPVETQEQAEGAADSNTEEIAEETNVKTNPVATITMESGDEIVLELYPEMAPESVKNFISLANAGFYDGLIFHRVIEGFMIQGGDPTGTGMGGPGYSILGEFKQNGVDNSLSHTRGVISMARSQAFDSAGSQFFIVHADSVFLDGQYAAFGRVTSGIDVVDKIASAKTDASDRPASDQVIKSITVDTFGADYGEPKKLS